MRHPSYTSANAPGMLKISRSDLVEFYVSYINRMMFHAQEPCYKACMVYTCRKNSIPLQK